MFNINSLVTAYNTSLLSNIFYWSQNINENKNWKVKENHLFNVNIKNQENNTSVFNFAKLKNKAVSVEKKVVHVHLNGNIPKKLNNRV